MRFAAIIDHLSKDELSAIDPPTIDPSCLDYSVQPIPCQNESATKILKHYADSIPKAVSMNTSWYGTLGIGPHTDDVTGDVTIGVVTLGDHYLFTGSGRKIGDLKPGTVYLLHNKKLHGALPKDKKHPTPLVFFAMDLVASYADAYYHHRSRIERAQGRDTPGRTVDFTATPA